ncbi:MAG: hypothetical protein JXL80_07095 [Planctomycetes bacterium]|nr:hypothetical protein [Planctomycetota bacterium]
MSDSTHTVKVPTAVTTRLRDVRRKQTGVRAAEAVLAAAAALLVAILLAMAVDWAVVLFSSTARTVLTLVALALAGAVFSIGIVRLVLARRRLSAVALDVERHVPVLKERWSTVVELAEGHDAPEIRGSDVLIDQVAREAEDLSPAVAREHLVSGRTLRWCALAAVAAVVVFASVLLVGGRTGRVLLDRFLHPTHDITLTQVVSLTGDRAVPRGEPLAIQARQEGRRCGSATLMIRDGDDLPREVTLNAADGDEPSLSYPIRAVNESFTYRLRCGDSQTPWHEVTAVDRPSIAQVKFDITPPEYAGKESVSENALPRQCRALEGSRLRVAFIPNKAVQHMALHMDKDETVELGLSDDQWYVFEAPLEKTLAFSVHATDSYGLTNAKPPSCRIVVYPDRPPSIQIVSPEEEISVRPDEVVPVDVKISDDIGIETAELVVSRKVDGEEKVVKVVPIDVESDPDGKPPKSVKAKVDIDLKEFDLKQGDEMVYAVQASDTRQASASASRSVNQGRSGSSKSGTSKSPQEEQGEQEPRDAANQSPRNQQEDSQQQPDDPKDQLASASSQKSQGGQCQGSSNSSTAKQPPQDEQRDGQEPLESASRPPNDMQKRQLPGNPTACSGKQRIQIDEWAGSYEGQRRQKLQLAIDRYLADLDAALAAAEKPTNVLTEHVRGRKPWVVEQTTQLGDARKHLVRADEVVKDLLRVSHGTPYAFIGYQLQDINASHVEPAAGFLADAGRTVDRPDEQYKQLEQAAYHIARARARLADLTKQYEAVKREKDFEEAIAHVKKMHQLFLEDMHAMLQACQPKLNPRPGQMLELPDEEIEKLKKLIEARHEELKKLMAALAEVMEKDPELLRRFMAAMRMSGTTVRDQLTLLAIRQQGLYNDIVHWTAGGKRRELAQANLRKELASEQASMAEAAAQLYDNMITWLPRDVDATRDVVGRSRDEAGRIARSSRDLARQAAAGDKGANAAKATELATELVVLDAALSQLETLDASNDRLAQFVIKRKAEARDLSTRQAGWAVKAKALADGKYGQYGKVDQGSLLIDTMEFGEKLSRYEAMLGGITPEIGSKARQLRALVGETIVGHQKTAHGALSKEELAEALTAETAAVKAFKEAEKVFDEMLTLIEKNSLDNAQPKAPDALCRLPSLEQLLAMLESEGEACEKLGAACMKINLMIQGDWQLPSPPASGEGSGSGSGSGSGQAAMGQAQMGKAALQQAIEQMEKMQREARQQARELTQLPREKEGTLDPVGERGPGDGREWDTLVSKLEKQLRQARDNVPPEQYRRFIEEYFRAVAENLEGAKSEE